MQVNKYYINNLIPENKNNVKIGIFCFLFFFLMCIIFINNSIKSMGKLENKKKYAYAVHQTSIKKIYHCIDTIM